MSPFSSLDFFLILFLVMLPPVVLGLRGKNLRVCGLVVTAVMLTVIFDTPEKFLTLAGFWLWQTAVIFSYLRLRRRAPQRWVLWAALLLSLALLLVKLSLWVVPLRALSLLGVSYMSFCAVQLLIEIYDD